MTDQQQPASGREHWMDSRFVANYECSKCQRVFRAMNTSVAALERMCQWCWAVEVYTGGPTNDH